MKAACSLLFLIFLQQLAVGQLQTNSGDQSDREATMSLVTATGTTITTRSTTTDAPTTRDPSLPKPTRLTAGNPTQTTLTLTYFPPADFPEDTRYSHFRIEYRRADSDKSSPWKWREILKERSEDGPPNVSILPNLSPGVLYQIKMLSQARDDRANIYILSPASIGVEARTKPLAVTGLNAVQSSADSRNIIVTWTPPPVEVNANNYDETVLTYYIEGEYEARFPQKSRTIRKQALFGNQRPTVSLTLPLILGAPYRFKVVTNSGTNGNFPTSSEASIRRTFDVPAPIEVQKENYTETTMRITWKVLPGVVNTTSYGVQWSREEDSRIFNSSSEMTYIDIKDLTPGSLYTVLVKSIQSQNLFGKESLTSSLEARTKPPLPEDVKVAVRTETSLMFNFTVPPRGSFDDILVTYQIQNDDASPKREVNFNDTGSIVLAGLESGALYQIDMTVFSHPGFATNNTLSILARTMPRLPTRIRTSASRGKIEVSWHNPIMRENEPWSYRIDYFPIGTRNENRSQCKVNSGLEKDILTDVVSGKGYYISMTTVAGSINCGRGSSSDYVTYSKSSPLLLEYTQPNYPRIIFWAQTTLNLVRIRWDPPGGNLEEFDYYVVNITRLRDRKSKVIFEKEEIVQKVPKEQQSYAFRLTQGATYSAEVITAVGPFDELSAKRQSIVLRGVNRIQFSTWHRYYDHQQFSRLVWKFTTCGRSGRFGPSQLLCDNAYRSTNLERMVEIQDGIQHWVAPIDGLYRVVAAGAGYEGPGGLGATVSGQFHLREGAGVRIAVGQRGRKRGRNMAIGGGGGSFVVADSMDSQGMVDLDDTKLMLAAGGAGSAAAGMLSSIIPNARLNYNGGNASDVGNGFGIGGIGKRSTGGPGMRGAQGTGGGSGYDGIADPALRITGADISHPAVGFNPFTGSSSSLNDTERVMYTPLAGGRYEISFNEFSEGGFGGGGSGYQSGVGGGGGYSGGGAGPLGGYSGGGGSYIKFTGGTQYAEVVNDQPGFVTITLIGLPVLSPIPITLYLVIAGVVGIAVTLLCGGCLICVNKHSYICLGNAESYDVEPPPTTSSSQAVGLASSSATAQAQITSPGLVGKDSSESSYSSEEESEMEASYTIKDNEEERQSLPQHVWPIAMDTCRGTELHPEREPDSESLSTVSSVSSMGTEDERKFDVDSQTGKLRYRGRNTSRLASSFTGFESTDAETTITGQNETDSSDSEESLPPPPPSPPRTPPELASEVQKADFRKKLTLFHEMAEQSRRTGNPPKNKPTFMPSTNL